MDALERKLRPIYDALDARNPKAALKLATAALQKHKDNQLLRVLKALALTRLDKIQEAYEVCEKVVREAPTDEQVLSILAMVYKNNHHLPELVAAYEAALKERPNDLQLLHVMLCMYTRSLDFVKQQQIAMKLHRLDRSNGFCIWYIVTSLVLQARAAGSEGQEAAKGEKLMQLAESMAAKQLEGHVPDKELPNVVMLYHQILQDRGKIREMLDSVRGPLGSVYSLDGERQLIEAALLARLGNMAAAASLLRQAALSSQEWAPIQGYFNCLLPQSSTHASPATPSGLHRGLINGGGVLKDPRPQEDDSAVTSSLSTSTREEAENTVSELMSRGVGAGVSKTRTRGAYLAAVDLQMRLQQLRSSHDQVGDERSRSGDAASASGQARNGQRPPDLAGSMLRYFQRLGHLASCATDLRPYSAQVTGGARQWLADEVLTQCKDRGASDEGRLAPSLLAPHIQRLVSAYQIIHDLGLPEFKAPEEAEEHAALLMSVYRQAAALEKDLDEKERGIADNLAALAAGDLIAAWKLEAAPRKPDRLLKAALVLESALLSRKYSAPLRLAATGLYGLLGAPLAAANSFAALDVKHIQHDTLSGHWLLPILLGSLCNEQAADVLTAQRRLYEDHARDAGDTVLAAFQAGTYPKVLEFLRFKERLAASHAHAEAYTEIAALALGSPTAQVPASAVQEAAAKAAAQLQNNLPVNLHQDGKSRQRALRFNEDLSTRPAWLPPHCGQPRLALAQWWTDQPSQPSPGYGRCWWACMMAAESDLPEARLHREASSAALQRRSLLPSLLTEALSPDHQKAAAALQGNVDRLKRLSPPHAAGDLPPEALESLPLPQLLEHIHASTFEAALAVQAALAGQEDAGMLGHKAAQALQQTVALVTALCTRLAKDLGVPGTTAAAAGCKAAATNAKHNSAAEDVIAAAAHGSSSDGVTSTSPADVSMSAGDVSTSGSGHSAASGALLTGAAAFVAAAFAGEEAYWLALCLQVWCGPLRKQGKKKKGKKGSAVEAQEGPSAIAEPLKQQMPKTCQAIAASLEELKSAVISRLDALAASEPSEQRAFAEGEGAELWGWEPKLDVKGVIRRIQEEQKLVLGSTAIRLSRALTLLQNA